MNWFERVRSILDGRDLYPALDLALDSLGTCEDDVDEEPS